MTLEHVAVGDSHVEAHNAERDAINDLIASQVAPGTILPLISATPASDYVKLLPWYAALSHRKARRADIVMLGDSIVEGYPVQDYALTIPAALRQLLIARFPTPNVIGGRGYIGIPSASARGTGEYPIVFTGGAFDTSAIFGGTGCKHNLWYANASGAKAVFTVSGPLDAFDILHVKSTAGGSTTGYYKIDGGAAVPFACNAASNTPTAVTVVATVNNTIEIGWNASGYLALDGIIEYRNDRQKGIQVHNCGLSSSYADFWNTPAAGFANSVKLLTPDLAIVNFGTNDSLTSVGNRTADQFKADLLAFIATLRAAAITCPIVLTAIWDSPATRVEAWVNYIAKMNEIATADPTVLALDLTTRMPSGGSTTALALQLYHTDAIHSYADGAAYNYVADTLASLIMPR